MGKLFGVFKFKNKFACYCLVFDNMEKSRQSTIAQIRHWARVNTLHVCVINYLHKIVGVSLGDFTKLSEQTLNLNFS